MNRADRSSVLRGVENASGHASRRNRDFIDAVCAKSAKT